MVLSISTIFLCCIFIVINMWRYLDGVPPPKKEKHDNEGTNVSTKKIMKKYDSTSSPKVRTFQTTWTNDRPWLRHDHTANKMYCDVCIKFGVANKNHIKKTCSNASVFISGSTAFKLENIKVCHWGVCWICKVFNSMCFMFQCLWLYLLCDRVEKSVKSIYTQ